MHLFQPARSSPRCKAALDLFMRNNWSINLGWIGKQRAFHGYMVPEMQVLHEDKYQNHRVDKNLVIFI